MASAAAFTAGGGDPRLSITADQMDTFIPPQNRRLHDPNVSFEEYHHFALKTRAEEDQVASNDTSKTGFLQILFPPKSTPIAPHESGHSTPPDEKRQSSVNINLAKSSERMHVSEEEWRNASRALRSASAAACFYLITTDILGPFGVGYSLGTLGWGPGIALFTAFGLMAGYGGYLLWDIFIGLDSYEFPLKNYGDLAFRIYGTIPRYIVNILQTLQLLCSVGLIIISNGQNISQVSKFHLCYAICCLIWAIAGFFVGQVRTLQKYGWLANLAVFLNLMIMFITMGVFAHTPPNYSISQFGSAGATANPLSVKPDPVTGVYPPIIHYAGLPDPNSIIGSINGLMQGVYAFGGAQLFVEFMAEMRRPRDFIKAMWAAQFFIYTVYMVYGCYTYYWQGQYTYQFSYQGVSSYGWLVVGDMLAVLSGIIAAGLYGNIGIKVLYNNLLMDLFNAPPLTTKAGKWLWAIIVPIYWSVAFIVAAAIPDFNGFTAIVSAFCVLQFCYSFPPALHVGFMIHKNAMMDGEGYDPVTGIVTRHDGGLKRWVRGYFGRKWYVNVWNTVFMLASLSVAGMGAYAACMSLIEGFKLPEVNAFSCRSPLDDS